MLLELFILEEVLQGSQERRLQVSRRPELLRPVILQEHCASARDENAPFALSSQSRHSGLPSRWQCG